MAVDYHVSDCRAPFPGTLHFPLPSISSGYLEVKGFLGLASLQRVIGSSILPLVIKSFSKDQIGPVEITTAMLLVPESCLDVDLLNRTQVPQIKLRSMQYGHDRACFLSLGKPFLTVSCFQGNFYYC